VQNTFSNTWSVLTEFSPAGMKLTFANHGFIMAHLYELQRCQYIM